MRNLFKSIFTELLNAGIKNSQAMKDAWKLVKLQGVKTVSFTTVNGEAKNDVKTDGFYKYYVSKAGNVIVTYKNENEEYRSFRLETLS